MYKLKPCAFCKSKAILKSYPIYGYNGSVNYVVECSKKCCSKYFKSNDTIYRSDNEAIKNVVTQWNERG